MAMPSLRNLRLAELKSFRKRTPRINVDRPHLGDAWLSAISMIIDCRVDSRSSFKVSLEKRFESWC
jgi:hypothetical protein